METTTAKLKSELTQFIGTESYWRHALNRKIVYTDGVKFFADKAGAYWLLDILATEPKILDAAATGFATVTLDVSTKNDALLTVTNGDGSPGFERDIKFTDCPPGKWQFYFIGDTICLPSEY